MSWMPPSPLLCFSHMSPVFASVIVPSPLSTKVSSPPVRVSPSCPVAEHATTWPFESQQVVCPVAGTADEQCVHPQPFVLKAQSPVQASVLPLVNPSDAHVAAPRLVPSHSSPGSMTPLPQTTPQTAGPSCLHRLSTFSLQPFFRSP